MNKDHFINFNSDSSESNFSSSDEASSDAFLFPKKRKVVVPIQYSSKEENDVESEINNSDDYWIEIESDVDDGLPNRIPFSNNGHQIFGNVQEPRLFQQIFC